jgi:hypothetical protein
MPYSVPRLPARIDKAKEGSFGGASGFTSAVKALAATNVNASKPESVKKTITNGRANSGFSIITSLKYASALAPAIRSKLTKTHT